MGIMLGNLTVDEIEKRSGVDFPDDIREYMNACHQAEAENIADGKWHCFDIPFFLVCGGMDVATKIYNSVKDRAGEFKQPLQIGLSK